MLTIVRTFIHTYYFVIIGLSLACLTKSVARRQWQRNERESVLLPISKMHFFGVEL